jgi:hypothetical protein
MNILAEYIISIWSGVAVFLSNWQTLMGAFLGASAPFLLWRFAENYREKKGTQQYLYYLQRMIVDQINLLNDADNTIKNFINLKMNVFLERIDENPVTAYSVNTVFFPLFSVRPLPDDVNAKSSGSGYIDNKIAKVYALSRDFPHIIDDARLQLKDTIERNEKIFFGRHNSPEAQKAQFKENIEEYRKMVKDEIIGKNFPIYMRKLLETLAAIEEKARMTRIGWKLKFDPRWKFYLTKESYLKAKETIMDDMDLHFKISVEKRLAEIEITNQKK